MRLNGKCAGQFPKITITILTQAPYQIYFQIKGILLSKHVLFFICTPAPPSGFSGNNQHDFHHYKQNSGIFLFEKPFSPWLTWHKKTILYFTHIITLLKAQEQLHIKMMCQIRLHFFSRGLSMINMYLTTQISLLLSAVSIFL